MVNVHNKILSNGSSDKFFPMLSTSMDILTDVLEELVQIPYMSEDCRELFYLLQRPHVQVCLVELFILHLHFKLVHCGLCARGQFSSVLCKLSPNIDLFFECFYCLLLVSNQNNVYLCLTYIPM